MRCSGDPLRTSRITVVYWCEAPRPLGLIVYYRVSTDRQGPSGLGLEAQQERVAQLASDRAARLLPNMSKWSVRGSPIGLSLPQLCKRPGSRRRKIAVAKLDRLARDVELILRLSRELNRLSVRLE
ncbi:MAG: recombinase family protein [Prochlorococcaceae cyanobacterium]